jgi:hypothetical protein
LVDDIGSSSTTADSIAGDVGLARATDLKLACAALSIAGPRHTRGGQRVNASSTPPTAARIIQKIVDAALQSCGLGFHAR